MADGSYTITASHDGFSQQKRTGIALTVGQSKEIDLQLTVDAVAQQVSVHVMSSTDQAHQQLQAQMNEQMEQGSQEDKKKWMYWFQGEWDKKAEEA